MSRVGFCGRWTRIRLLRLSWVCALAVVLPSVAYGQVERGELRLVVSDETGLPLVATGTLSSEAPQLFRTFTLDPSGRFTLQDLPFGVFRLSLERSGFIPYSEVVEIHTAVPRTLTVQLALSTVSASVTVTGEPPLVDTARTGVVFSIGAPQLRDAMPAVPGRRMLELVDAQPGWLMEANGVLHPRGSEYQTLFVIDGVPMDENRSPAFAPDLQDNDVQGMGVLTGNFPAEYGRKLGGVIEVTTARDIQRGFHGMFDSGVGSFRTASAGASARYGWNRRALTMSASGARTDRYLDPPTEDNFSNHGSLRGVTAAYDAQLANLDRIRITGHHRTTDFLVPNDDVQEQAGQRQERTGSEDLLQGQWTALLRSRFVLNVRGMGERIGASLTSNSFSTPIVVSQDRSLTRGFVNASVAADFGRHQTKFGGDLVVAPVRESLSYVVTDAAAFPAGIAGDFAFRERRTDREQSMFAQDTMRLGDVTLSAGLRFDRYSLVVRDQAFSPRLGIAWAAPGRDLVLRASYDRAFQTPAVENLLLASSGQTDLASSAVVRLPVAPSRGNFIESGLTVGVANHLRLDVTTYRRTFSQFADDDVFLNTGVSFPVALDSARIRGVDSKLTLLPVRRVSGFASYSWLKGTARLPLVGGLFLGEDALDELEAAGDVPITQDQRHTARAQLRVSLNDHLWVSGTARYGSGLPVELEGEVSEAELRSEFSADVLSRVDLERGRLRSNLSLDLGVGAGLWRSGERRLTLRMEAANLTNHLNVINFAGVFSGMAIGPPRSVSARVQFQF